MFHNSINKKIYLIIILFIFSVYEINSSFNNIYKTQKNIFTFWEPKGKIPGYLSLCIKTWQKYLPEYTINILDYQTVKDYLGNVLFSNIICKNMSLPLQSDAIRVALLKKYGGIWLDTDTIIINGKFIKQFEKYELGMIGVEKTIYQYIGFIYASKKSALLGEWLNQIIKKVRYYKNLLSLKNNTTNWKRSWKKIKSLFYLGYDIINPLLKDIKGKQYLRLDSSIANVFPEKKFFKNNSMNNSEKFQLFYFENRDPQIILNDSVDLILLHNTWTPLKYKNMSENDFLKQDILISKLLSKILIQKI